MSASQKASGIVVFKTTEKVYDRAFLEALCKNGFFKATLKFCTATGLTKHHKGLKRRKRAIKDDKRLTKHRKVRQKT